MAESTRACGCWLAIGAICGSHPVTRNTSLTAKRTFDTDGLIRFFHVHMHLRGRSYAFRFTYPDGRVDTPFEVPNYDFQLAAQAMF
jgi:hypothetical protein